MTAQFRYADLGDEQFQQLVQATLAADGGGDVRCFPLNQTDGGRDVADGHGRVFQVKFSVVPVRNPAAWLSKTLESESKHFRWLIDQKGMTEYYVVTNIEGSSAPEKGHRDQVEEVLNRFQKQYKINFFCWWRSDMDARVVNLPFATKHHFGDMLIGNDYVAYLAGAGQQAEKSKLFKSFLGDIAAAQFARESEVRFKQDDVVHGKSLSDLFIDVEVESEPSTASRHLGPLQGGACQALLATSHPAVLLRGAPGQGKSTLLQYACQCYRATFLNDEENFPRPAGGQTMSNQLRFPIRIDLKDYADWMTLSATSTRNSNRGSTQFRSRTGFRYFLASYLGNYTGRAITTDVLTELLERLPVFLGLDGLDEIADQTVRSKVVEEIDLLVAQVIQKRPESLVVVTTRPSFGILPEPRAHHFTHAHLLPLSTRLKDEYIAKWAKVYDLTGEDISELQGVYKQRSKEPYFSALTGNPMQMTVILPLIHRFGASTPTQRTELYQKYMELLFARESDKDARILAYRGQLEDVTPYLGWRLQSEAEDATQARKYTKREMVREIARFLLDLGVDPSMASDLFTGAWQRIWVLTCKDQVHFEFEVQSVREYFAAKFLASLPERDGVSPSSILLELCRREYWSNTTRFLAGFLKTNVIPDLADTITQNFDTLTDTGYRSAWNLLSDGIFQLRPLPQKRVIKAILSDAHATEVVAEYMDTEAVVLPPKHGGSQLVDEIRTRIEEGEDNAVLVRIEAMHASIDDFIKWWEPLLEAAIQTPNATFWLRQGKERAAAAYVAPSLWDLLDLGDTDAVRAAVDAGASPVQGSAAFDAVLREVLDGQWSQKGLGESPAHDIIGLAHPVNFIVLAANDADRPLLPRSWRKQIADRASIPVIPQIYDAMKGTGRGQKGTTAIWHNSAYALTETFGPTWLAACIAIIGSLTDFVTGGNTDRAKPPLGPNADYGQLISKVRANARTIDWWSEAARLYTDPLSQRVWCLAFVFKARRDVVEGNLALLDQVVTQLDDNSFQRLVEAAQLIAESYLCPRVTIPAATHPSQRTLKLLSVFAAHSPEDQMQLPPQPPLSVLQVANNEHWLDSLIDHGE